MMKISVVIPTYKRPLLLMECLTALARQHFDRSSFEVLVVSDGPDKFARQLVASWEHTGLLDVTYLPLECHKGPAAARNAGWKLASGELVAFTDDDCVPDEHWLERLWDAHQEYPQAAFAGRLMVPVSATPTDYEWNTAQLENADFVTANCAVPRRQMEKVGGFDERFRAAWREDSDLAFSLLRHHVTVVSLPAALVVHPVRKAGWGVSMREQKKTMFNALLMRKFPDYYRRYIRQWPPWYFYAAIAALLATVVLWAGGYAAAAMAAGGVWLLIVVLFTTKRLRYTSRAWRHVAEMFVTSACIPLLSVYWHFYGLWKFGKL